MKLRNKKTGEICELGHIRQAWREEKDGGMGYMFLRADDNNGIIYNSLAEMMDEWEDYKPKEPLIKDEKIRKAVRAWAEAENCTSEMNLYYTLNRQEKYIIFHNPQTGSELQLCDFDSPVFQEMREYTIAELCGEEEE